VKAGYPMSKTFEVWITRDQDSLYAKVWYKSHEPRQRKGYKWWWDHPTKEATVSLCHTDFARLSGVKLKRTGKEKKLVRFTVREVK